MALRDRGTSRADLNGTAVNEISIRPLRIEDEAPWRELWRAYLEFYETTRSEEVYRTTFARLLSASPGEFRAVVAEREGRLTGLAHYLFHRRCWSIENVVYLQDLYVAPEARGTGTGRALIEAVYRAADAAGCSSVYWLTQDFNTRARRLYDQVAELTPFIRYQREAPG